MVRQYVNREPKWYDIPILMLGLVSDIDYLRADIRSAQLLQNTRCRTGRIRKRNGTRYYSPAIAAGIVGRIIGLHQWCPATATNENFVYVVSSNRIFRLPWDSTSVDPPTSLEEMAFPAGHSWSIKATAAHFCDFNDYCFAFNGKDYGMQMSRTAPNTMHAFGLAQIAAPIVTTSASGGSIAAGIYQYRVRAVREIGERRREFWGAKSDPTSVKTIGATSSNTIAWTATKDALATHYYIERTLKDQETFYYLARVPVGTTNYVDTADLPTDEIDDEVLDRIKGIRYAAVDAGVLFAVGDTQSGCNWYSSAPNRPQEFGIFTNDVISEGTGEVTGCVAFNGNVFVFREKGIAVFTQDTNKNYYQSGFISGYGCIAPWSVRVIRDGKNNYVTFFDDNEGPCLLTTQGILSIKRGEHSDIAKWVDHEIDPDNRKFVSVGYKNGYIYWSYAPEGSQYNTRCLVYDTTSESWYGPDIGYSMGPSITRINGRGVFGSGEMLAAVDGPDVRVMEMDAPYSRDFGEKIVEKVSGMAIAADLVPHEMEFQAVALIARLSNVFRFDISCTSSDYSESFYIAPSQKWHMDDGTLFDSGATFDQALQTLMDKAIFDSGDLYDTQRDLPYEIELDSCACQGAYMLFDLYDEDSPVNEICGIRLLAVDRGGRI